MHGNGAPIVKICKNAETKRLFPHFTVSWSMQWVKSTVLLHSVEAEISSVTGSAYSALTTLSKTKCIFYFLANQICTKMQAIAFEMSNFPGAELQIAFAWGVTLPTPTSATVPIVAIWPPHLTFRQPDTLPGKKMSKSRFQWTKV